MLLDIDIKNEFKSRYEGWPWK